MDQKDFDHHFQRIVESINMPDLKIEEDNLEVLSIWDVNRAVLGMTEASMYLSRFIGQCLQHEEMGFPTELMGPLKELIQLTDFISEALTPCGCPECLVECPDCTEDQPCEECLAIYISEEDDDD